MSDLFYTYPIRHRFLCMLLSAFLHASLPTLLFKTCTPLPSPSHGLALSIGRTKVPNPIYATRQSALMATERCDFDGIILVLILLVDILSK